MNKLLAYLLILIIFSSCSSSKLPTIKYKQYNVDHAYSYESDNLEIKLKNPLKSPLRLWIKSSDIKLSKEFKKFNPITLEAESDTVLTFKNIKNSSSKISFASRLGDTSKEYKSIQLALPYPNGKKYKVIQGNNSNYTHNTDWSRFAVDFNLKLNDTVCAATNGFIVGVIDSYKYGGKGDKWNSYANFITIYEPSSGLFTQYVHLKEKGSFVQVGDEVKRGQPIALSGMTGNTDTPHLHFNCLTPTESENGLKSIPFQFIEGYKSTDLKKGDITKKLATTKPKPH